MASQDTIETLIRFKLNVPELRNDFRAVANEVEKLNAAAITAGRGLGDSLAAARDSIGVRAFKEIRQEIAGVISAFDTLKTSGKLSGRELESTFNAATKRVTALREELLKNATPAAVNVNTLSRNVLGVRSADDIRADIQKVRDAYRGLAASGKLSGQELETAFSAARKRIRELRDEAQGAQFVLRRSTGAGAGTPQGPPNSAQPGFLGQTALATFGQLTGAFTAATLAANILVRSLESLFSALASGVVFLRDVERATFGIAGILTSLTEVGNTATRFGDALGGAGDIVRQLNDAALATAASSKDLITAFQGIVGPGLAAKLTLQQIITLSVTGVNAVKSLGLNSTQVVQEIRDLVQGGIQPASSTLATALGIRDSDINKLRGDGQKLFDFLNSRLQGFAIASQSFGQTFSGAFEQAKDVFTRLLAIATEPVFNALRQTFIDIVNAVVKIDPLTKAVTFNPRFLEIVNDIAAGLNATIEAVKNLTASLSEFAPALGLIGIAAKLITQSFLAFFDVLRVGLGGIAVFIGTLINLITAIPKAFNSVQAALARKLGFEEFALSLENFNQLLTDTGTGAQNLGLGLITAEPALNKFNDTLSQSSVKTQKAAGDLSRFQSSVASIVADSQRIAQGLQTDVNKTAAEADKLLKILEALRGRNVNADQKKQISEQLLTTRQALNRSAKDFGEAFKPITDVLKSNLDTFVQGVSAVVNTRAGVRSLSFEFQKLQIELGGAVSGIKEISGLSTSGAFLELADAFTKVDTAISAIDEKARQQRIQIQGSFDAARAQLELSKAAALLRPDGQKNSGIIGLQDADAARQLSERQARELAQVDRASAVERRQIYEQMFQSVQGLAQNALAKYREYAQQVQNLDKQIANNRLDLQTSEQDIQRQGKSTPEQLASIKKELLQLRQQTAQAINQNAHQLVSQLVSRRRSLARELLSLGGDAERQNALGENRAAATEQIGLLEKQRKAAAEARDQQLATFQSLQVTLSDIQGKIEAINSTAINIQVAVDQASLQAVIDQVRSAVSNIVATVRVQALIDSRGAGTQGFAGGGHVWGAGTETSDSILARLSRNEWVMRAKAVQYWGKGFMSDINAMRMPRFAGGGAADGSGASRDSMDLNLSFGGNSFRLSGQRDQVRGLVDALHSVSRGLH